MANNKVKALIKPVIPAILVIVSFLGILFVTFFYLPFFSSTKVINPIFVTSTVGIDFYGLILPLLVVFSCLTVYIKQSLSRIAFAIAFFCCLLVALSTSNVTDDGLMMNPAL